MGRGSGGRVDRHRDKSSLARGLAVSGRFDQGRPLRSHSDGEPAVWPPPDELLSVALARLEEPPGSIVEKSVQGIWVVQHHEVAVSPDAGGRSVAASSGRE